jgi:MFS family permease
MGSSGPAALLKNGRVFLIAMFACIGGLLYGYNQGVFSGVLTMPSFQSHMGDYDSTLAADQSRKGWLTSILELGAWIGTLLSGFLAEAVGRKRGILIATGIFVLGVVVQTTAIS